MRNAYGSPQPRVNVQTKRSRHTQALASASSAYCIIQTTGWIGDRKSDPGVCGPLPAGGGCTPPTYSVRLDRAQHSEWLDVSWETYRAVQTGDPASVRTWHGTVVQLAVNGHTETYDPTSTSSLALRLAAIWLALGMALWTVRSGYLRRLFSSPSVGWVWLSLPIMMTTRGLLVGMSVGCRLVYRPAPKAFELVLVAYVHLPPAELASVLRGAAAAVALGGTLFVVGHDLTNLTDGVGGPPYPDVLYTPEAVAAELPALDIRRAVRVRRPVETDGGTREAIDTLVRAVRPNRPS